MNLRVSLVLIIIVSWVLVGVSWVVQNPPNASSEPDLPFFYTLSPDDLRVIRVATQDGEETFRLDPVKNVWFFEDPAGIPVSHSRWGGMTFLLGGPKTQRVISASIDDRAKYGLDKPNTTVEVTLKDGSEVTLMLGNETADGKAHYGRLRGFDQLVLVDSSWGNVIARLVSDPPYPEWLYTMDTSKVTEILFFLNNDVVRGIAWDKENERWVQCDLPVSAPPCTGDTPVDSKKLTEYLDHIAKPKFVGVAQIVLDISDLDRETYGVTEDAPYIDIRIETSTQPNVTNVSHVTLLLGDLTEDGSEEYVLANEQPDVVLADAGWARKVREFFDDQSLLAAQSPG